MSTFDQLGELRWSTHFDAFNPHLPGHAELGWMCGCTGALLALHNICFSSGSNKTRTAMARKPTSFSKLVGHPVQLSQVARHVTAPLQQRAPGKQQFHMECSMGTSRAVVPCSDKICKDFMQKKSVKHETATPYETQLRTKR